MNTFASLSWCCISIFTSDCFGRRANGRPSGGRMLGKFVPHVFRRQGASTLRSLARTAASLGTGGGLRGRPRGLAAALSAAAAPPSP